MKKAVAAVVAATTAAAFCVFAAADEFSRDMIYCEQHRYCFDKEIDGETAEDSEWEFEFQVFKDATFTVNTINQCDLLLGANCDYDEQAAEPYKDAALLFFNGNGDCFHHYGTLFLPAEKGSYIYNCVNRVIYDSQIPYDEQAGGFLIRTRHLVGYVISDRKLDAPQIPAESDLISANLETITW